MLDQTKSFLPGYFRLKRTLIIGGVFILLFVAEIGVGTEQVLKRPYLLAIPFAPLFLAGLSAKREWGVVGLVFTMMVLRFGFSTGTASVIPLSLVFTGLLAGFWLVKKLLDRNLKFLASPINLPALVFLSLVTLSMFWSRFFLDPQVIISDKFFNVQLGTIGVTALSIVLTIFCFSIVRNLTVVKTCFWAIVIGSLWYLPFYFYEVMRTQTGDLTGGEGDKLEINLAHLSRIINAGGLFPMWVCALTLALLLFCHDFNRWQRFFMWLVLAGWLFRLLALTITRISAWLPALVAILIIIFIYSRKWFIFLSLVALVIVILNYQFIYDSIVLAKQLEGTLDSSTSRDKLWGQALKVAVINPVLGTGPAGYANYYMTYYRDLALSTHNNFLDMLLQYGLLGLGAFLWLCLSLIKELSRFIRVHPAGSFEKAFTIGAFAGMVGVMPAMWLGDWFIPFAYNQTISGYNYTGYSWLFVGLALALGYKARERKAVE
jgi:O-antigen ligase